MGIKNRILVTGATGFVGQHTLPILLKKGYEVHAISTAPPIKCNNITWHRVNLLQPDAIKMLIPQVTPTHLMHFAWYTEPGKYWNSVENFKWLDASLTLIKEVVQHGTKRIVIAGSCAEYDWSHGFCTEEITPFKPQTIYGACKNALRSVVELYAAQHGVSAAWGPLFFIYGPHEHPSRLVSSIISSLLKNTPAKTSHGRQIRDFMHVEDAASAFVALLETDIQGVVNIGSGTPISVKEIAEKIAASIGRQGLLRIGAIKANPDEPPLLVANTRRLVSQLGWKPRYDIDSGLKHTIHWWETHFQRRDNEY